MAPTAAKKALVLTKQEYDKLHKWIRPSQKEAEDQERSEFYKKLDETSKKMTREWPNSVENVNKRNEELRLARIAAAEQANKTFYDKYMQRKEEEQARMMYSARDTIFKNKDATKLLLSAVIESAVQKERQVQLEYQNAKKQKQKEAKDANDALLRRNAEEWHKKQKEKQAMRLEASKKYQQELVDQATEIAERTKKQHMAELEMQIKDAINGQRESEAIKEFEENMKQETRERIFRDMDLAKRETDERRRQQRERDALDDKLIDVLDRAKCRIDQRRKETENRIQKERHLIIEAISKNLATGSAERDAKEKAILEKAIQEQEALQEAQRQARLDKDARNRAERLESRRQYLEDEARRIHEMELNKQWEIINRYKNHELYEEYKDKQDEDRINNIKNYRKEILEMVDQRKARDEAERQADINMREMRDKQTRETDNRVLTHARALLREASDNGRPLLPINRTIDLYCKLNRMYPMPPLPKSLQEQFKTYAPWDQSQADPWYKYPLPPKCSTYKSHMPAYPSVDILAALVPKDPVPEPGPSKQDRAKKVPRPPDEKRDGMQNHFKRATASQTPGGAVEVEGALVALQDFKRLGPANGLQRQQAVEIDLPCIDVVPYRPGKCANTCADPCANNLNQ